jgi:DNA polymerase sigma
MLQFRACASTYPLEGASFCSLFTMYSNRLIAVLEQVCDRLRELVKTIWPHAELHLFGSQATGLALPGSDLDVVILGVTPVLQNAAQGFTA